MELYLHFSVYLNGLKEDKFILLCPLLFYMMYTLCFVLCNVWRLTALCLPSLYSQMVRTGVFSQNRYS